MELHDYKRYIKALVKINNPPVNQCAAQIKPTYAPRLLHILHISWPDDQIELVKAHYTARGVKAIIRDLDDEQTYALEIYPELIEEKEDEG